MSYSQECLVSGARTKKADEGMYQLMYQLSLGIVLPCVFSSILDEFV